MTVFFNIFSQPDNLNLYIYPSSSLNREDNPNKTIHTETFSFGDHN